MAVRKHSGYYNEKSCKSNGFSCSDIQYFMRQSLAWSEDIYCTACANALELFFHSPTVSPSWKPALNFINKIKFACECECIPDHWVVSIW